MRKKRKDEHIASFMNQDIFPNPLFQDIYIEHQAISSMDMNAVSIKKDFLGKSINAPIYINAMTGGTDYTHKINMDLARLALEYGIPMAVGSMSIVSDSDANLDSFRCIRDIVTDSGLVFANMNAFVTVDQAQKAIDLSRADALQIHVNPAQELAMVEGDRDFTSVLSNIEALVKKITVPIIVKEVGFGLSASVIKQLASIGVPYVDVAGMGGTNFIQIEADRSGLDYEDLYDWGIPTALALLQVKDLGIQDLRYFASGGVSTALDIFKSLVLGADLVGCSGGFLRPLLTSGEQGLREHMGQVIYKLKMLLVLSGVKSLEDISNIPYIITGRLRELFDR